MVYRIPSTFVSSHAYGGMMVSLLPLLVLNLERGRRWMPVAFLALLGATLGVFVSACPIPGDWNGGRRARARDVRVGEPADPGYRRGGRRSAASHRPGSIAVAALRDTVGHRVRRGKGSKQRQCWILRGMRSNIPLGLGLGSAVGTSIPYFLEGIARPQYGMENEFARIALEEGVLGVVLWCSFVAWVLLIDPGSTGSLAVRSKLGVWACCVVAWSQAAVGTGLLASVPGTMILFVYMGLLVAQPERRAPSTSRAPVAWSVPC